MIWHHQRHKHNNKELSLEKQHVRFNNFSQNAPNGRLGIPYVIDKVIAGWGSVADTLVTGLCLPQTGWLQVCIGQTQWAQVGVFYRLSPDT